MDSQGVLSNLFSFVGKGHYLYVAGVSRSWRINYTPRGVGKYKALVTTFHDAIASNTCLEYGFANGLEFTAKFHPEKDDFGPGVYEWARQHGFPLYVWVAKVTSYDNELYRYTSQIRGVFSTFDNAKEAAAGWWNDNAGQGQLIVENNKWRVLIDGSFAPWITDKVCVKLFAIDELVHADEINPLPLCVCVCVCVCVYVTCRTDFVTQHYSTDKFIVEGVFPTKELANVSVKSMALHDTSLKAFEKYGFWSYTKYGHLFVSLFSLLFPSSIFATEWEGYLDGEGGRPGKFFSKLERERKLIK